ncbi:MAG: LysE family translocator [Candidatus Sericytochromatia bacterium]
MSLAGFGQGLVIGLSVAAPVGPIGLLCIRRTLEQGVGYGLATGLGAAVADAAYGCIAALGLGALSALLTQGQTALSLIGGLFVIWLGWLTWRRPAAGEAAPATAGGILKAFASSCLLTLTNPMTILAFAAIFTSMGAGNGNLALLLVAGVFTGSALWWLLLSGGVGLFRRQLGSRALGWIQTLSGLCLVAFGLRAALGAVWEILSQS